MVVTVIKATVVENIFKCFYDLLAAVTGFSTIIYPEFPEVELTAKGSYPVAVLDSPEINSDTFTLGQGIIEGTISFTIYTANDPKTCDQYSSDVIDKIETSKFTLAGVGLRQVQLDSALKDVVLQGKIKVHFKTITWRYKFYYAKTKSF